MFGYRHPPKGPCLRRVQQHNKPIVLPLTSLPISYPSRRPDKTTPNNHLKLFFNSYLGSCVAPVTAPPTTQDARALAKILDANIAICLCLLRSTRCSAVIINNTSVCSHMRPGENKLFGSQGVSFFSFSTFFDHAATLDSARQAHSPALTNRTPLSCFWGLLGLCLVFCFSEILLP